MVYGYHCPDTGARAASPHCTYWSSDFAQADTNATRTAGRPAAWSAGSRSLQALRQGSTPALAPTAEAACSPKSKTITTTGAKSVFRYGCGNAKGYVEDTSKDGFDARVSFSTYGGTGSNPAYTTDGKGDRTDFTRTGSWYEVCVWRYSKVLGGYNLNCDKL